MDIVNKYIEYTLLKPDAKADEIIDLCNEAIEYKFASVCINPTYIVLAKELLDKNDVKICTVIGFPLGANTNIVKLMETKDAIEKGANEIDVVINIGALKDGKIQYILNELQAIKKIAGSRIVKANVESSLLTREEIISIVKIIINAGIEYIVLSTGFFPSGNVSEDIDLIKKISKNQLKIKIQDGFITPKEAKNFINNGIDRISTLNAIGIYKSLSKSKNNDKNNKKNN